MKTLPIAERIRQLNARYAPLTPEERIERLYSDFEKVIVTSSFGTKSVYLLHMLHGINPDQEVCFIDTGYHFLQTYVYRNTLAEKLGINIVDLKPDEWQHQFTLDDKTWEKDPDLCCSFNKVEPLEKVKKKYDVWMSGLLGFQTEHRANLNVFEVVDDMLTFYPIIDVKEEDIESYFIEHQLPIHPLKELGYSSVGCYQCTSHGKERNGRWAGRSKTECGLHLGKKAR